MSRLWQFVLFVMICVFVPSLAQAQLAPENMPIFVRNIESGPNRGGREYLIPREHGTPMWYVLSMTRASLQREDSNVSAERVRDQTLAATPGRYLFHAYRNGQEVMCRNGAGPNWSSINAHINCAAAMPAGFDLATEAPTFQTFCRLPGCRGIEIWTVNGSSIVVPGNYHETPTERLSNATTQLQAALSATGGSPQATIASAQQMATVVESVRNEPEINRASLLSTIQIFHQVFNRLAVTQANTPNTPTGSTQSPSTTTTDADHGTPAKPNVAETKFLDPRVLERRLAEANAQLEQSRDRFWKAVLCGSIMAILLLGWNLWNRRRYAKAWKRFFFSSMTFKAVTAAFEDARRCFGIRQAWPLDGEVFLEEDLIEVVTPEAIHELRTRDAQLERDNSKLKDENKRLKGVQDELLNRFHAVFMRLRHGSKQIRSYLPNLRQELDVGSFMYEATAALKLIAEQLERVSHEAIRSLESQTFAAEYGWHPSAHPTQDGVFTLEQYIERWSEANRLKEENKELRTNLHLSPTSQSLRHNPFAALANIGHRSQPPGPPSDPPAVGESGLRSIKSDGNNGGQEMTHTTVRSSPPPPAPNIAGSPADSLSAMGKKE